MHGHVRVLLVEDDEDDYLITQELLQRAEDLMVSLDWVPEFDGALDMIAQSNHDVYLVDYRLGARNGMELVAEARSIGCTAPFILLTGQGDQDLERAALRGGAEDYLRKQGLDTITLERSIRHAIERRRIEQRYRDLFESAADAIITMGDDNRIVLFNAAAESMFGYQAAEVIGEPLAMLMPERFRDVHPTDVKDFAEGALSPLNLNSGRVVTGLRGNGEEFPIDITISKQFVGENREFTAMVRDVTGRQRDIELRELVQACITAIALSEDASTALAAVLQRVGEYVGCQVGEAWVPTADGSRLQASPAFYFRTEEMKPFRTMIESIAFEPGVGLPGRVWTSKQPLVIPRIADDPDWVRPGIVDQFGIRAAVGVPALAGGEVVVILVFRLAAAPSHWADYVVEAISTVAAQLGSTIRQKFAEEDMRVTGARSRAMLDALPDQYFRLSPEGTYLEFQYPERSGFSATSEGLVGKQIEEALPPELAVKLSAASTLARESGQVQVLEYEYEINGTLHHREARIFPIPETDETAAIVRDVTNLVQSREALEASLRSKDELIASIAHEMRTPLTGVVGFAQILMDEDSSLSPAERAEMIRAIVDEGVDLTNIVEDLLTAAKSAAGTLTVVQVPVELRAQSAQVLENWPHREAEQIELTESAVRAIGDPARVRQILRNLISNALKYGGNSIRINLNSDQTTARVAVCDNGHGVPSGYQERIFEPYQRAHHTPGLTASMGLGLSTARQLARLMNGDLTYQHQTGQTTFELTLPKAT